MSTPHKLSLQSAILMNLNIMAGAGIFVNIVDITTNLNLAGGLLYLTVGVFMFPLIFTFAKLVEIYPSGGFYSFAKPISPLLGFISNWTYFFGKLASASMLLFVASTFLKQLMPTLLAPISTPWLSIGILSVFMYLNILNLRTGIMIQRCFLFAKSVPLVCMIGLGIYLFDINIFSSLQIASAAHFITMLPLVLYCFSGFESACSISRHIENPSVNAPKAIFYSFFTIVAIYVVFQTLTSMMLLPKIGSIESYSQAYPYLATLFSNNPWIHSKIATALSFLFGFSAMGGAYGLLFSNSWNLYTLAQHGHTLAANSLICLNRHGIPTLAVLVEGLICCFFLYITQGSKIPLMQTASLGCTTTYTISTVAFLWLNHGSKFIGFLSLLTCSGFIISCAISSMRYNFTSLYLFLGMFLLGLIMYLVCLKKR